MSDEQEPTPDRASLPMPITLKYDPELEPGRFIQVRTDFIRSAYIPASAKILYLVLCSYAVASLHTLPSSSHIAQECGLTDDELENAFEVLLSRRLLTPEVKHQSRYRLHATASYMSTLHKSPAVSADRFGLHIPLANHTTQMEEDTKLLTERLGISEEVASNLAQLVAERRCSRGYVADVVEYATTTLGIKNPAGCAVELIRRNERRKPSHLQTSDRASDAHQTLDPEKYTSGKYAFLFRPQEAERGEAEESDGQGDGGQGA